MISRIAKMLSSAVMIAGMGAAIPADGASLPPNGSTAYAGYFACHHLGVMDMGESGSQTVTECIGITRNISDPKLFDNMSVRCLEDGEVRFGYKFTGWCAHTDGDGDKLFTSYTGSESGPVAYIGGTGKYKDISLEGTWAVHYAPPLPAGQFVFAMEYKVQWQAK